jgi:lipopolysaccharide transport system ATP-binding protein
MDAIALHDMTKTYRAGVGRARVREMLPWPLDRAVSLLFPKWWRKDTFDALKDVTLSVPTGTSLGIVGHNGAGKTTLLKVIAQVTEPTSGTVEVAGRVAALIDVVVGFHPELTGRENVFLLGAIHGFGRKAMAPRLQRIFEFADVDSHLDTPVKRYSSGMLSRLGFATLTALEVDVLLIDEVLAVGDAAFQQRCVRWLQDFQAGGGTLLFVSHNLGLVRGMTDRVVWINQGQVVADGATADVLAQYATAMEQRQGDDIARRKNRVRKAMTARGMHRWGLGGAQIESVHIEEPINGRLDVTVSYESEGLREGAFYLGFVDELERELGGALSSVLELENGRGAIRCHIQPVPLRAGIYFPVVAVMAPDGKVADRWRLDRAVVIENDSDGGLHGFGPVSFGGIWDRVSPEGLT